MRKDGALRDYWENGFHHRREAVAPSKVAAWRDIVLQAAAARPNMSRSNEHVAVFEPARLEPELSKIVRSAELAGLAAKFLEAERLRLFAVSAYIKPPGGDASFWHQDMWFFPISGAPIVTVWLPLSAVEEDQAPMIYARKSHLGGFMDAPADAPPEGIAVQRISPMAPGDVVLHDGWTLHGSAGNQNASPREALGLVYVKDGARFSTRAELESVPARFAKLTGYIGSPDYKPGKKIAGPKCPLVPFS